MSDDFVLFFSESTMQVVRLVTLDSHEPVLGCMIGVYLMN